jgi:hypothetical protein
MKRAIAALLVIALLGALSPGLPILAKPLKTPHENPAAAGEAGLEDAFLLTFSDIIKLADGGQYGLARDRLEELRQASPSPEISYVIDQYRDLYEELFAGMDDLEGRLEDISALLAQNRTGEARELLEAASAAITGIDYLVNDTEAATDGLDEKLDAFAGLLPDEPLALAYDSLQQNIGRLTDIVASFETLQQDLSERYTQLADLTPVEISLDISPHTAFVGEPVAAAGRLGSGGRALPGRTIAIVTGNTTLATAIAAANGSYKVDFTIPYHYADSQSFAAAYRPTGDDAAIYLGAQSPPVAIDVDFYPPQLSISLPETVWPGQPFTLNGEVATGEGAAARRLVASLGGETVADTSITGHFSLELAPPPGTPAGQQDLEVFIAPEGRYAGAHEIRRVTVAMMNLRILAETAPIVLLPLTVRVRGSVYNGPGPVGGAPVELGLEAWRASTVTAPDGSFQFDLPLKALPAAAPLSDNPLYLGAASNTLPFNLSPIGWQELKITTSLPGSPFGAYEAKRRVVSANPFTIGLLAAVFAAVWVLVYRRQGRSLPAPLAARPAEISPPTPEVKLPPAPVFSGLRGRVLAAYHSGQAAVEKISGAAMGPDTTLREFLDMTSLPSAAAGERFTELTGLAENTLYSRNAPRRETAARAEELAHTIKEDLDRGAA